jgi:hypothetical protein
LGGGVLRAVLSGPGNSKTLDREDAMGGLFNSTTLDVMVGLIFVYILLAIMCSSINEWLAGMFHLRSGTLTKAVQQLLDGQSQPGGAANDPTATWLVQQFKNHPLISGMNLPNGDLPSYIPSRTFATAVMDLVTPGVQGPITFADLQHGLGNLPDGDVKRALLALTQNAQDDLEKTQKNIETWFDDAMSQASGWYKKQAARITIAVAILLTVGTNADTIQITRNLWTNPTVRAQLVEQSKQMGPTLPDQPKQADLDKLGGVLPSWKDLPEGGWLERILGWILTIAAVSLGAPFWFDILGKIANLRNAGQKPKTAQQNQEEAADANA